MYEGKKMENLSPLYVFLTLTVSFMHEFDVTVSFQIYDVSREESM